MSNEKQWDVFICHASEDKEAFVDDLATRLRDGGLKVWYDKFSLKIGDSLRRKIDEGLSLCRYGIVVLSNSFFIKDWPQRELDGLTTRDLSEQMILPIWHNVSFADVKKFSLPLADRLAGDTSKGIDNVVRQIIEVVKPNQIVHPVAHPAHVKSATGYTLATLQNLGIKHDKSIDWSSHRRSIFQSHSSLNLTLVEQVEEALLDENSYAQLNAIFNRLLGRNVDSVGKFFFLPWIYYRGAHGLAHVQNSILISPEYHEHLSMRKMGAIRISDKIIRFRIDKFARDGLVKTSSIVNGIIANSVSGENLAHGYVPRDEWDLIADNLLTSWKIREYTIATERLHGYSVEIIDNGAPTIRREEDYWRMLKRRAVFEANAFLDNLSREYIANIINPTGQTLISSIDKNGNYRKIEERIPEIIARYNLHEVIEESISRNSKVRVPSTIELVLTDYVLSAKAKGVLKWERIAEPVYDYVLKVTLPSENAAFDISDFVNFASTWAPTSII